MTSATDVITYVGVPLAVLGVFPLIFNLIRCLIIWRRLLASVSSQAKYLIHLNVDPVGGSVTCSMDEIQLELSMLIDSLTHGDVKPFAQDLRVADEFGLGATWMGMLELKLPVSRSTKRRRCVVDSSLRADISTLSCDWQTFVYISLALGVAPDQLIDRFRATRPKYTNELFKQAVLSKDLNQLAKAELSDKAHESSKEVMLISLAEKVPVAKLMGTSLKFSMRRALAWELIMVISAKAGNELVPLFDKISQEAEISQQSECFLAPKQTSGSQRDISNAENPLQAALIWTLYCQQILHSEIYDDREHLPVPQQILRMGQEAADELRNIPELESFLKSIFESKPAMATWLFEKLRQPTGTNGHLQTSHRACMTLDPGESTKIWGELQQNATFKSLMTKYNPSPRLRTEEPDDLSEPSSLNAVLARVIIVTAVTQNWKRQAWGEELSFSGRVIPVLPPNPMTALLEIGATPPPGQVDLA